MFYESCINMKKLCLILSLFMFLVTSASGQGNFSQARNSLSSLGGMGSGQGMSRGSGARNDSLSGGKKQIPKGVTVWTVDKRFGDRTVQLLDTITHLYPNSIFTSGTYGDYNFTGNLGSPRINRIFLNRSSNDGEFLFTQPYDYFLTKTEKFLFTNTYSPYANLSYDFCGNRLNGEDHFEAKYGVNVNKQLGFGFKLKYLYGRGYYDSQSTSLFDLNLYGSYIGDQYQAHLILTSDRQKITENGGITNDQFITNPEIFDDNYAASEIPTMLQRNWNRNSHQHIFLTHRYNIGFNRKVPMTEEEINAKKFAMESKKQNMENEKRRGERGDEDEDNHKGKKGNDTPFAGRPDNAVIAGDYKAKSDSIVADSVQTIDMATADSLFKVKDKVEEDTAWLKNEYVPVTSFIHTAQLDSHKRIYQAYYTPTNYYADDYFSEDAWPRDSIFDQTKYFRLRNTVAISMLEGFNKWAMAGIKLFAASDLRHYALPDTLNRAVSENHHTLSLGAQISRTQGKALHYSVTGETWILGEDQKQVKIDGSVDLNFPLFGDTVTLAANGFFHNEKQNYFLRHFHSRHYWWDDDLSMQTHTRLEGLLSYQKTRTTLRVGVDELTNYTYLGTTYDTTASYSRINNKVGVFQSDDAITVLTASLDQKLTFGIVNWENIITYQKSTKQEVLPVPTLNIYSNLYFKFKIAKVLYSELGCDMRFFTEYEAPEYVPGVGLYAVQLNDEKVKLGNYPMINAYANFNLKGTRFFVMYSHANAGSGNRKSFLTPHYPLNGTVLRIGISWNFFN